MPSKVPITYLIFFLEYGVALITAVLGVFLNGEITWKKVYGNVSHSNIGEEATLMKKPTLKRRVYAHHMRTRDVLSSLKEDLEKESYTLQNTV